jgi:hypothetical protein
VDGGKLLFVAASLALVALMALRGWRLGIVRQAFSILALALAYAAGWFGGGFLIPVLRPIGFPDRVLTAIGAACLGLVVFAALTAASGVLFKRTAHQSVGVVRFGFGFSGAVLGAAFGVFLVLVSTVAIRLLGAVAAGEMHLEGGPSSRLASRLAELKHSIEQGATGAVIEKLDPVPEKTYEVLSKAGRIVADPDSLDRFTATPGLRALQNHEKILALRDDPEIAQAVRAMDFLALLRHPKLVAAANDPEVLSLLSGVDLEKAFDTALPAPPASRHPKSKNP